MTLDNHNMATDNHCWVVTDNCQVKSVCSGLVFNENKLSAFSLIRCDNTFRESNTDLLAISDRNSGSYCSYYPQCLSAACTNYCSF